jgi:nucleoid-associated protein YejK
MSVDEFCNYLQSKGYVLKKQIPYSSGWVSQFLQFSNTRFGIPLTSYL